MYHTTRESSLYRARIGTTASLRNTSFKQNARECNDFKQKLGKSGRKIRGFCDEGKQKWIKTKLYKKTV